MRQKRITFVVDESEKYDIKENAKNRGFENVSLYMRYLARMDAEGRITIEDAD